MLKTLLLNKVSDRVIIAIFAGLFFVRNLLLPLISDDYSYAFIWNGEGGGNIAYGVTGDFQRVSSFYDIIISQWSHYFTWGGRIVAHSLVQFFMWIGKIYFDFANTIMFVLLVMLIYWTANVQIKIHQLSKFSLLWIFLGIWICIPEWLSTMLWLTGACNYLWMAVLQLLFLLPYVKSIKYDDVSSLFANKHVLLVSYCVLGLLAGWSNEAGGFVILCLTLAFLAILKYQKKLQKWAIAGVAAFILGYALLILAPGNLARANMDHPDFHWNISLMFSHLTGPFCQILSNEAVLFLPIIYYFIRLAITGTLINGSVQYYNVAGKTITSKLSTNEILILIFTAAGLLVPIIMLVSPEFPLRSCFDSTIFLLIASTSALNLIRQYKLYPNKLTLEHKFVKVAGISVLFIWLISIAAAFYADVSIYRQTARRFEIINVQSKDDLIVVPPLHPSYRIEKILGLRVYGSNAISLGGDLHSDQKWGQNILFAKYYGLKEIVTGYEVPK